VKSKKRANSRRKRPAAPQRRGFRSTRWTVIAAVIVVVAAATLWWVRSDRGGGVSTLESPESVQKLLGSWQRTDAGYVIDIRSIDRDGAVDAAYHNPSPIHVSQARASDAGGSLELFVELMDVGYPGATYRLRYNAEYDALVGLYHQPTAGQDFEVAFARK
jgi:hypothetical protein